MTNTTTTTLAADASTTTTDIVRFEVGEAYSDRSTCDYNCIFTIRIAKRTKCFVTTTKGKRLKISVFRGREQVFPHGKYSMCTVISADRPSSHDSFKGGPLR